MSGRRRASAFGTVLVAAAIVAPAPVAAKRYRDGEPLAISGRLTDGDGRALAGVSVLLEVSHRRLRLPRLTWQKTGTLRIPTRTDTDGGYAFEWPWDGYYDLFELVVALPVPGAGEAGFEVFRRVDITPKVRHGPPVVAPLVIEDASALRWLQSFLAGEASEHERRVYREMGRPERIDRRERRGGVEISWWYFAAGRVYRFQRGEIERVVRFEPITPARPPER